MKKQQIQAKGWLLKWESRNIKKESVFQEILLHHEHFKLVQYIVVVKQSQEKRYTIYAYIKYNKRVSWSKHKWDMFNMHGTYQPSRSWKILYPIMKVSNWISSGINIDSALRKKASKVPTQIN